MSAKDAKSSYFSYTDAHGVDVVVDRLADVPEAFRARAKHIDLSKPALTVREPAARVSGKRDGNSGGEGFSGLPVHGPSFAVGAATGLMVAVLAVFGVLAVRRTTTTRLLGLLAMAFVIVCGLGMVTLGYVSYLRREAGLPGRGLAPPSTLLNDARAAASAMNQRNDEQARALQSLDQPR
jgi:hypothetical protein